MDLDTASPYYPHRSYPKLVTPQWVGEEGVEAVVIFAIDDMRDHRRYETFLRPIIDRLKKVDGRGAVSIMTCRIDPATPQLQAWMKEGLAFDAHTVDHPCPLLAGGDFAKAKSTYDRCVDQLFAIPNHVPVAFRTPCCDSLNTPSPRMFAEIFGKSTPGGRFLTIDSSVFNVFSGNDPAVPRELVLEKDGRERFRKYVPFESFVNTIEDYPYPYAIGGTCWEFPCATPSDWQGQYVNKNASPVTLADWKANLDVTVKKRGVMTLVFHPYGWSTPEQWVELIDYAQKTYGGRVKFLNFREANERLEKSVGRLRDAKTGEARGLWMRDLNGDGYLDVCDASSGKARVWSPQTGKWSEAAAPAYFVQAARLGGHLKDLDHDGTPELIRGAAVFRWDGTGGWKKLPIALPRGETVAAGVRFADVDEDGFEDVVVSNEKVSGVYLFDGFEKGWAELEVAAAAGDAAALPLTVRADGSDNGFFVHSRTLWWQNEDTAKLPNLVDRRTFNDLMGVTAPRAKGPAASLACVRVAPGFKVELVAAEPLVEDPIAFAFGPDGKLWVVEMPDYPLGVDAKGTPGGRVKYLEDLNGDGVYDKATLFLEKLPFPTSVLPWKKGVLVTAAPEVFYAEDTDGDGRADQREVLFTGFKEGNQQHRLNHLSFGLDNWIYGANGDSGGAIKSVRTGKVVNISGRDFRLRPDTGEFQAVAGQSQFGRSRSDAGDWFGCNNSDPLYHFPLELDQLERNRFVPIPPGLTRVHVPRAPGAAPVFPVSRLLLRYNDLHTANHFTSACSAHVYRDDLFPEAVAGSTGSNVAGEWVLRFPGERAATVVRKYDSVLSSGDGVVVSLREDGGAGIESAVRRVVLADGTFQLPLVGEFAAAGKTGNQVVTAIGQRYREKHINVGPMTITLQVLPVRARATESFHVFISEPVHNLVHREVMTPSGSTFVSDRLPTERSSEFLASSDPWFRPTTVAGGPDGALYVADMYRHVIEHPEWISKENQATLDLRAGHDKGRIYRVSPVHAKRRPIPRLDKLDSAGLVKALESASGWERDLAQWMLVWRGDAGAVEWLERVAVGVADSVAASPLARVHALWALHGMGQLRPELIVRGLTDGDALVRRHAVRLVREVRQPPEVLWAALSRVPVGSDPRADLEIAYALGYWRSAKAGEFLGRLATAEGADAPLVAAVVSSLNGDNVVAAAGAVASAARERAPSADLLSGILQTALGTKRPQAVAALVDAIAVAPEGGPAAWQYAALANLLESLDQAKTNLSKLGQASPELKAAAGKVVEMLERVRPLVDRADIAPEARAAIVPLLAYGAGGRTADLSAFDRLLVPQTPGEVQRAVVAALARRRDAAAGRLMIERMKALTPDVRAAALDALLSRPEWSTALLDAIEAKAVIPADIDAAHRQRLLQSGSNANRIRATELFAASVNPDRQKVLDAFKDAATLKGDVAKGKAIFGKTCATCHKLGDTGNTVGPDIVSIGDKTPEGLLAAILDPNRAVETRYINYIATTKDDDTFTGLLAAESANSITLLGPDAKPQTILRSELRELRSGNTSLMPEGLEAGLTPQDLADLIAFLRAPW